jgi:predicted ATP-grasp superfamily ATP-dependent carboligase
MMELKKASGICLGKSLLVVGFNSRPIAKSLYRSGFVPYAVDFFGDLDLPLVTAEYAVVAPILAKQLDMKSGSQRSFQEIMVELASAMVEKHPHIKGCFLGSGFDDHPELVEQINSIVPIIGTNAKGIRVSRDFECIRQIATKAGFQIPKTIRVSDSRSMKDLSTPYVLTPTHSSGGLSKRLIQSPLDFQTQAGALSATWRDLIAEEYVAGHPMSCTFIKTGELVKILAINDQVIGESLCHPPGPFYYCGNVTPTRAPENIIKNAQVCCQKLAELLPVQGMNGFDFVGTPNGIYFMEVNPRIPGSLAPIENALDRCILDAVFLPASKLEHIKIHPKYTGIKYILYAPQNIPTEAQKVLRQEKDISDIPSGESIIAKGDPICTVLTRGKMTMETLGRTRQISREIYSKLLKKSVKAVA